VKKAKAEKALRYLVTQWANETGFDPATGKQPSFSDFKEWLEANRHCGYLNFRSTMGPLEDAERWFDQELKQTWRN
jgi:hypothetical protein